MKCQHEYSKCNYMLGGMVTDPTGLRIDLQSGGDSILVEMAAFTATVSMIV